jgi:hypothetical protein
MANQPDGPPHGSRLALRNDTSSGRCDLQMLPLSSKVYPATDDPACRVTCQFKEMGEPSLGAACQFSLHSVSGDERYPVMVSVG